MGYPIQFQENEWEIYECSFRCTQARQLMRPGEAANDVFLGCLGRASEVVGKDLRIHFGGMTGDHCHLVLASRTATARADFKKHVKTNGSKELGLIYDWSEGIFGRRTRDIFIAEDALEDRLMYAGRHGCKDGLVETPRCWPGVQWVRAVTEGVPLQGTWYKRTEFSNAMRNYKRRKTKGVKPKLSDFAVRYTIELHPLPGHEGLSEKERRAWWVDLMNRAVERYPTKRPVLGAEKIKSVDPHSAPKTPKRSTAPFMYTNDPEKYEARRAAYRTFVDTMRAVVRGIVLGEKTVDDLPAGGIILPWTARAATA